MPRLVRSFKPRSARQSRAPHPYRPVPKRRWFHPELLLQAANNLVIAAFALAVAGMAVAGWVRDNLYWSVVMAADSPDAVLAREVAPQSARIYDRNGEFMFELFDHDYGWSTRVPLDAISPYVIEATLATEDVSFYENEGVDVRGILRAAVQNKTGDTGTQGGSSITQQLIKNVMIPPEERTVPSISRKIREAFLAMELTQLWPKDKILTEYLNRIYYGNLSYGIESAAQHYFGKSAKDLTLPEAAMLAGLPQAPTAYSPLANPNSAKARQAHVLNRMVIAGYLTDEQAKEALDQELVYAEQEQPLQAPHFVNYVRDLVEQRYGKRLYTEGLQIYTSLDLNLQHQAEEIVKSEVAKRATTIRATNAALTAIQPSTGQIIAMVGSADFNDPSIDGQVSVATSERQPGSSFKPITYITAFTKGYSPATVLEDKPIVRVDPWGVNPPWMPLNFDKTFKGQVTIREALANSMNIPAIHAIEYAGIPETIAMAHRLGITTLDDPNRYGAALTLGGGEVKLLDLTYVYSVFANGGRMAGEAVPPEQQREGYRKVDPVALLKVQTADGRILLDNTTPERAQVIEPEYAYLITDILADNEARMPLYGTNLRLPGPRPAAVKTGTTENLRDFWTVGYTPQLAVGVWMGNSNNVPLTGGTSGTTTGPIWEQFMTAAHAGLPVEQFKRPEGVVDAPACSPSGKCRNEVFVRGSNPVGVRFGPGGQAMVRNGGGPRVVGAGCAAKQGEGSSWPQAVDGVAGTVTCRSDQYYFQPAGQAPQGELVSAITQPARPGQVVASGCATQQGEGVSWPQRVGNQEGTVTCRNDQYVFTPVGGNPATAVGGATGAAPAGAAAPIGGPAQPAPAAARPPAPVSGCSTTQGEGVSWPQQVNGVNGIVTCRNNQYEFRPVP